MIKAKVITICLFLNIQLVFSQVRFASGFDFFPEDFTQTSTLPLGFADINGDGWDDLISFDQGHELAVFLSSSNTKRLLKIPTDAIPHIGAWSLAIGDCNNNGVNDIVIASAASGIKSYELDPVFNDFRLLSNMPHSFFPQASNLVDINQDGWLDLFVCNDNGLSKTYVNSNFGNFVTESTVIDMRTDTPSDNSGNYGSLFCDIDSDGDLDLYLSKCRAGVHDPADPRRVNALYINDGANNFVENAAQFGLADGDQTWATAASDLDWDGDLDLFSINHFAKHALYENLSNQVFVKKTHLFDEIQSLALQALIRDFDNNGFEDILVTGDQSFILWNNGNLNFEREANPFGAYEMKSAAVGDINRDGFLDLFASIGSGINEPGNVVDHLLINQKNENHFVSFKLVGTDANRSGIGATVTVIGEWGTQKKTLVSGESYGVSNSLNLHFGLGAHDIIAKVVIAWPSGQTDEFFDLDADEFYILNEGNCISKYKDLPSQTEVICEESIRINNGAIETKWLNQSSASQEYTVESESILFGIESDSTCPDRINPILVQQGNDGKLQKILGDHHLCGDEAFLYLADEQIGLWSHGIVGNSILVHEIGNYSIIIDGACGIITDTMAIGLAYMPEFSITGDSIKKDELAIVTSDQAVFWYDDQDTPPIGYGTSVQFEGLESNLNVFAASANIDQIESISLGEKLPFGTNEYSSDDLNASMLFTVFSEVLLETVTVYTDRSGTREIMIFDALDQIVFKQQYDLLEGENQIDIYNIFRKGDYRITTNAEVNQQILNHKGPRLVRSNRETLYPYLVDGLIGIYNSNFGPSYYSYFYDWQVIDGSSICYSALEQATVVVEGSVSTVEQDHFPDLNMYPIPFNQSLSIETSQQIKSLIIMNLKGQKVMETASNATKSVHLSLKELPNGTYLIKVLTPNNLSSKTYKVVKQD